MNFIRHILRMSALFLFAAMMSNTVRAKAAEPKPAMVAALKELQRLDQRVHDIGYRLVQANRPFCIHVISHRGYSTHKAADYGDQAAAQAAFGFGLSPAINTVIEDSPAAIAGLHSGDVIVSHINNSEEIKIRRGDAELIFSFRAMQICDSAFEVQPSKKRYANADGKTVAISTALIEFMRDDNELASVLAHELAHNLLNHRDRLDAKKVNRGFFGQFGKSAKRIKQTEIEADRLSIWLMANAGYAPEAAIRFWTRYGKKHGKGIFSASTHYRWKKRVGLFEEEIAQLAMTQPVSGKYAPPLLVEMKTGKGQTD